MSPHVYVPLWTMANMTVYLYVPCILGSSEEVVYHGVPLCTIGGAPRRADKGDGRLRPAVDPDRDASMRGRLRVNASVAASDAFTRDLVESLIVFDAGRMDLTHSFLRPPPPHFTPTSSQVSQMVYEPSRVACILIRISRSFTMAPKVLATLASHNMASKLNILRSPLHLHLRRLPQRRRRPP